jgi:membrane protease YdiL (CAAX protease family)
MQRAGPAASRRDLRAALVSVLVAWGLLAGLSAALRPLLGAERATLAALAAATVAALATRRERRMGRGAVAPLLLGGALGVASRPVWLALVEWVGVGLGLPPARYGGAQGAAAWLGGILLAPLLEEVLYRERLLRALRPRLGALPALLLSSAAFAAPHLHAWWILGTFLVGLGLGAAMLATGSLALCVGLHAGLNLAALAAAVPGP